MRFFPAAFVALVFAVMLGACSNEPSGALKPVHTSAAALEARIDALQTAAFTDPSARPADIAALIAALPQTITVKIAATRFDAASGATILTGVDIAHTAGPDASPEAGITIDEMKVWDLDTRLAISRLNGQDLGGLARLARRIEAKGVSLRGLESLMTPALDAYRSSLAGALSGAADTLEEREAVAAEMANALDLDVSTYSFTIASLVLDDVVLRPFVMKAAAVAPDSQQPDSQWAAILPVLQSAAAWWGAVGVDTAAFYDISAEFAASQADIDTSGAARISSMGMRGMRGGDTDLTLVRGIAYTATTALPGETPEQTPRPLSVSFDIDRYSHEGLRLAKAISYLARSVMPPRKEADLLSLGVIRYGRQTLKLFDRTVSETASGLVDLSEFHWLVPTRIRLEAKDVSYDIAGLRSAMDRLVPPEAITPDDAAALARSDEILTKLKPYGLDKPTFDIAARWDWNPLNGMAKLAFGGGLDQYLDLDTALSGDFPSFRQVSDLVPENGGPADEARLAELFEAQSAFTGFHLQLAEDGDIGRLFELAHDMGAFGSPDDPAMNYLAATEPLKMRTEAAAFLFDLSRQAGAEDQLSRDLLLKTSEWVGRGGVLRVEAKPKKPVPLAGFSGVVFGDMSILDQLGISITHTPRATPPAVAPN